MKGLVQIEHAEGMQPYNIEGSDVKDLLEKAQNVLMDFADYHAHSDTWTRIQIAIKRDK